MLNILSWPSRNFIIRDQGQFERSIKAEDTAIFHATVCSNRCREPIECRVEWMGVSDWLPPTVTAKSCIVSLRAKLTEHTGGDCKGLQGYLILRILHSEGIYTD